jgi:hypothetical protein
MSSLHRVLIICTALLCGTQGGWAQNVVLGDIYDLLGRYLNVAEGDLSGNVIAARWADPRDPRAFPDLIVQRELEAPVGDLAAVICIRQKPDGSWNDLVVTLSWDHGRPSDLKEPKAIYQSLLQQFGTRTKVVDSGFLANVATRGAASASLEAQWKKGGRAFLFQTTNIFTTYNEYLPLFITFQITDQLNSKDLVDLAYLRLQFRSSVDPKSGAQTPVQIDQMVVVVDLNQKRLESPGWQLIGSISELSPDRIVGNWGGDKSGKTIEIDRYAGTFVLKLQDSSLPGGQRNVIGTFEGVDPQKAQLF